ncbi:MAG: DUF1934 domain-containing protein [Clostridiales Family XIII bacterium]|jgi:uncharacterized beta-barrel protein YwiB (DUF1934 family)|nr:DUF1934 domain-containing protein [Clostridiales Family XIII bacterium]
MKDIRLKIIGNQIRGLGNEPAGEDAMEFITEGRFMKRGDSLYLIYDESELSGVEGCTTSLKVSGGSVKMRRYGAEIGYDAPIEFEQGKRWDGYYDTPFGPVPMEVLTNEIHNTLEDEGTGSLWIDCSICLRGLSDSRSKLSFEIMQ